MRRALASLLLAAAAALSACATPGSRPASAPGAAATGSALPPGSSATSPAVAPTVTPSAEPTSFAPGTPWPRLVLRKRAEGLVLPLYVTTSPADPGRLLVVEKGGVVRAVRDGTLEPKAFLDISGRVSVGPEQGLLSIAFPPGAAGLARVYVCYTAGNGDVVIERRPVAGGTAGTSGDVVLRVPHHAHANHNGGLVLFGPDGMLYAGIGDGGSEGDPDGNGQRLDVLLAKILRLDVEGLESSGGVPPTYLIPRGNPFANRAGARPETWLYGLRNPWRFSFDAATDELYIGDVGQDAWEEIDVAGPGARGLDFGWSIMEGSHTFKGGGTKGLTPPVAEYGHDLGNAVTGGYVYRGAAYPSLRGVYVYADSGSGRVWGMRRESGAWRTRQLLDTGYAVSSFGEDASHELYLTDLAGGAVYQLTAP